MRYPIRALGAVGLVKDISPYDLPPNAWSEARNVRFDQGRITRAPIFRKFLATEDIYEPTFGFDLYNFQGENLDSFILIDGNGEPFLLENEVLTSLVPLDHQVISARLQPYTAANLGQVFYYNHPVSGPYYLTPGMTEFDNLPDWNAGWRAAALRPFKDFLIALNVTKSGQSNPYLVKWSDLTLAGAPPASWDITSTTNSAGENPLFELDTPLVDGLSLRNDFIIYSRSQVYLMEYIGGPFIFQFRKIFNEGGMINQNCAVEHNGTHYVFGVDDIYVHDGISKRSIVEQKMRREVFNQINTDYLNRCFVHHSPRLNEVMFFYVSRTQDTAFPGTVGCNKALVFNYASNTLYEYEVNNVFSSFNGTISKTLTWSAAETLGLTYNNIGGSYADLVDTVSERHTVLLAGAPLGGTADAGKVLVMDFADRGVVPLPADPDSTPTPVLSRIGIDMDEMGSDLETRKMITRVFPQLYVENTQDATVALRFGKQEFPSGAISWAAPVVYNPETQYKVDVRLSGRYLAIAIEPSKMNDFEVSGYDLEVKAITKR